MSCFFSGIIQHSLNRTHKNGECSKEFNNYLYKINQIAIDQKLTILMGGNIQSYVLKDIKDFIPINVQSSSKISTFLLTRSPEENTSDELFNEWECGAWKDTYKPGDEKVFKELQNFFEQTFALDEVEIIWARYRCMHDCEVYKIQNLNKLEAEIYKQCSSSSTFEVSDFEIYMEKEKS